MTKSVFSLLPNVLAGKFIEIRAAKSHTLVAVLDSDVKKFIHLPPTSPIPVIRPLLIMNFESLIKIFVVRVPLPLRFLGKSLFQFIQDQIEFNAETHFVVHVDFTEVQ